MNKKGSRLQVGENTVLSFITAASLGAEYVEFGKYIEIQNIKYNKNDSVDNVKKKSYFFLFSTFLSFFFIYRCTINKRLGTCHLS